MTGSNESYGWWRRTSFLRMASKTVAGESKSPRAGRQERRVLELRQIELQDGDQIGGAERTVDLVDVLGLELQLGAQQLPHRLGATPFDLEADRRAEAPAAHVLGDAVEQVAGLVLADLDVGVARDAKRRRAEDLHAGEEAVQVRFDELLEENELELLLRSARDRDEAPERGRDLDPGERGALLLALLAELDGKRNERFERNGNGCAGSKARGVRTGNTTFSK